MIQLYLLSVAYLVFSALLILVDSYRRKLSFMIKVKSRLREDSKRLNIYFAAGLLISLLNLFLPMSPGPTIIGDLVPSLSVLFMAFFFRLLYSEKNRERSDAYLAGKKQKVRKLGLFSLVIALIHFLFPHIVLL